MPIVPPGDIALLRHLIAAHGWELRDLVRLAEERRFEYLHEAVHRSDNADHDHPKPAKLGERQEDRA